MQLKLGDIYLQRNSLGTLTLHGVDTEKLSHLFDEHTHASNVVPNFASHDAAYGWAVRHDIVALGQRIPVIEKVKK